MRWRQTLAMFAAGLAAGAFPLLTVEAPIGITAAGSVAIGAVMAGFYLVDSTPPCDHAPPSR